LLDELRRRRPSTPGIFLERALEREQKALWRVWPEQRQRSEVLVLLLVDDAEETLPFPRAFAREHLPSNDAEAVEIRSAVDGGVVDLLGRHVGRRADRHPRCCHFGIALCRLRDAEVREER